MARSSLCPLALLNTFINLDRLVKTHINMVCSTLQLEDGSLPPLMQENLYCIEKADKPHKKQKGSQGKQKENRETLIEAFYSHDDPSTY